MHLLKLLILMQVSKARAVGYSHNSFAKISEKSWTGKDDLFLLQNSKDVYSGYFVTKWLIATWGGGGVDVHTRAQRTNHYQPHLSIRWTWCHLVLAAVISDKFLACIPIILIFLAYLYHSTFYHSTKSKKISKWTFIHITR